MLDYIGCPPSPQQQGWAPLAPRRCWETWLRGSEIEAGWLRLRRSSCLWIGSLCPKGGGEKSYSTVLWLFASLIRFLLKYIMISAGAFDIQIKLIPLSTYLFIYLFIFSYLRANFFYNYQSVHIAKNCWTHYLGKMKKSRVCFCQIDRSSNNNFARNITYIISRVRAIIMWNFNL